MSQEGDSHDAGQQITVLEHIKALLGEMDLRYQQRFDAQTTAINAALLAAEKAVTKAETAADKRFELLNELRIGVATKDQLDALEKVTLDLSARVDKSAGRSAGLTSGWGWLIGAMATIAAVVGLFVSMR